MLQAQNIHMSPATRSPQQRMMTIAIVAAFHVAVITTFLVALSSQLDSEAHTARDDGLRAAGSAHSSQSTDKADSRRSNTTAHNAASVAARGNKHEYDYFQSA